MRFILILALLLSCQSGILSSQYPQVNLAPTVAVESTFRVMTKIDGVPLKSGTAWVVSQTADETRLFTAGHVCTTETQIEGLNISIEIEGKKSFTLMNREDQTWEAEEVKSSKDPDLCILKTKGKVGFPLPLAEKMPAWGDPVGYVGAPRGFYGQGVAMYFQGNYSGNDVVSIFTAPGASGAALFNKNGVFGVLVAVHPSSDSIVLMVSLSAIKAFIDDTSTK